MFLFSFFAGERCSCLVFLQGRGVLVVLGVAVLVF